MDTSLILTLSGARELERVLASSQYDWQITPMVRSEITCRGTRELIDRAMTAGRLRIVEIDTSDQSQMNAWAEWESVVDIGEAEAIALALARSWIVGLEGRQAQRALDRTAGPGRWVNATNLLLDMIADGTMTLAEANAVFVSLDSYPGYRRRGILGLKQI